MTFSAVEGQYELGWWIVREEVRFELRRILNYTSKRVNIPTLWGKREPKIRGYNVNS